DGELIDVDDRHVCAQRRGELARQGERRDRPIVEVDRYEDRVQGHASCSSGISRAALASPQSGGSGGRGATGRPIVKVAPRPVPGLSAWIAPPCSWTRWRTSERPRRRPLDAYVAELSSLRKRSKTNGRNNGEIPRPLSATVISPSSPIRSTST